MEAVFRLITDARNNKLTGSLVIHFSNGIPKVADIKESIRLDKDKETRVVVYTKPS